jgi:DNA-directed RNA polymerase subunit RPC12/RpoP
MSDIIYRCNKCGSEFASLDTLVEHKITCAN